MTHFHQQMDAALGEVGRSESEPLVRLEGTERSENMERGRPRPHLPVVRSAGLVFRV